MADELTPIPEEPLAIEPVSEGSTVQEAKPPGFWRRQWSKFAQWILPAILISVIVVGGIFALILLLTPLARNPPVYVSRLEAENLGELCPGAKRDLYNSIDVRAQEVIIYYVSVKYSGGLIDVPGTNTSYPGTPYPVGGIFDQTLPWKVPDLLPGSYILVVTARGADGRQKASMITSTFTIADEADKGGKCEQ